MPSTVLAIDQPCCGVDTSNPGAVSSTSMRPLCTMAMPRVLAARGSPAPTNASCTNCCKPRRSTPSPQSAGASAASPCGHGRRGSVIGRMEGPEGACTITIVSASSTQPRLGSSRAWRSNRPAKRAVTVLAISSTEIPMAASTGLAGTTSSASSFCHGRPATNAAEQIPLAAMPAALPGMPSATSVMAASTSKTGNRSAEIVKPRLIQLLTMAATLSDVAAVPRRRRQRGQ